MIIVAILLVCGIVIVSPLRGAILRAAAESNPELMRVSFVADAVGEVMDGRPDRAAGTDPTPVDFVIAAGSSSSQIIDALVARDLVTDRLAFSTFLPRTMASTGCSPGRTSSTAR